MKKRSNIFSIIPNCSEPTVAEENWSWQECEVQVNINLCILQSLNITVSKSWRNPKNIILPPQYAETKVLTSPAMLLSEDVTMSLVNRFCNITNNSPTLFLKHEVVML